MGVKVLRTSGLFAIHRGRIAIPNPLMASFSATVGSLETGSAFGSLVPGRVYAGHLGVTIRAGEKKNEIAALYGGRWSREEARDFLASNGIDYVVVGPEERKLGSWDPGAELGLQIADREGATVAYRTGLVR